MRRARRTINEDRGFSHIMFRTNGGDFLFKLEGVKEVIIEAAKKYKEQYGIKIIDYCIMSNHAHFTMYYPTVDQLSRFMHDMNLFIAKAVNKLFERQGKVIRDRFLSPVVDTMKYCMKVLEYIWMNPVNAKIINIKQAQNYKYCSLYYRHRGLKDPLADSYQDLKELTGFDVLQDHPNEQRFAVDLLNALKSRAIEELSEEIFDHPHTIGSKDSIKARLKLFKNPTPTPKKPDSS